MKVSIHDREALLAVSPAALSAYARSEGWIQMETYRSHSDVYVCENRPEIIIPRNEHLGDYASVVWNLIDIFAEITNEDQEAVYRNLITADRDIIRIQTVDHDHNGSLPVDDGAKLVCCARDMLTAVACSLDDPRSVYRPSANQKAKNYLQDFRLGQTDQGSFVINLLSSVVIPPMQMSLGLHEHAQDDPISRQVTIRLAEALATLRKATDDTNSGNQSAFRGTESKGVSENLCEALATLTESLSQLTISLTWARTYPRKQRHVSRFATNDAAILRQAVKMFRSSEPQHDMTLVGFIQRLTREQAAVEGTVRLRTLIDGKNRSIDVVLSNKDYDRAIRAHATKATVIMKGDLETGSEKGQRLRLLEPSITGIIENDDVQIKNT